MPILTDARNQTLKEFADSYGYPPDDKTSDLLAAKLILRGIEKLYDEHAPSLNGVPKIIAGTHLDSWSLTKSEDISWSLVSGGGIPRRGVDGFVQGVVVADKARGQNLSGDFFILSRLTTPDCIFGLIAGASDGTTQAQLLVGWRPASTGLIVMEGLSTVSTHPTPVTQGSLIGLSRISTVNPYTLTTEGIISLWREVGTTGRLVKAFQYTTSTTGDLRPWCIFNTANTALNMCGVYINQ